MWCTDDEYYYRQRFIPRDLRSCVVWICGWCRYADVQNSSISIDHETLEARKVCSVQLWTMTKNFDTNYPNIRYWPWASSFKVTEQNYFSIYFSIILPICTHCQPLKWSQVCIQWNLCKTDSGLLKGDFVRKCACFWEFIVRTNIISPVMAQTERTRRKPSQSSNWADRDFHEAQFDVPPTVSHSCVWSHSWAP